MIVSSLNFKIIKQPAQKLFLCNRFHIYQYYNTNGWKSKDKFLKKPSANLFFFVSKDFKIVNF